MIKLLLNRRSWLLVLFAGAMPLGTVSNCDYSPAGGTFFLDQFDDDDGEFIYYGGSPHDGYVVVEEDYYYEDDYYYDEYYYDEYYDDCNPLFFWECW